MAQIDFCSPWDNPYVLNYNRYYMIVSLALGMVMAILVEFPVLRLRDRWFPSRAQPQTAARAAAPPRRVVGG